MDQSPADLNEITLVPSIEDNSSNSNSVNNNEPPVGISAAVVSNPINKVNSDSINSVKNDTGENGEDVETNECEGENGSKFVDAIMRRRTLTSPFHSRSYFYIFEHFQLSLRITAGGTSTKQCSDNCTSIDFGQKSAVSQLHGNFINTNTFEFFLLKTTYSFICINQKLFFLHNLYLCWSKLFGTHIRDLY